MSKQELQDVISKQQNELARYKTRLTDLVAAHKCLIKEKETLEASLKAFTKSSRVEGSPKNGTANEDETANTSSDQDGESAGKDVGETVEELKGQLGTLMNSIATLSEEKSRMEANFQADKRLLRQEKNQLENTIKDLQLKIDNDAKTYGQEIKNYKSQLIVERHQREKEMSDHHVVLRELQMKIAEERGKRERAEVGLETARRELREAADARDSADRKLRHLNDELEQVKKSTQSERERIGERSCELEEELRELRESHLALSRREVERARQTEELAERQAVAHEERVAGLEAKLAHLSTTIAEYHAVRLSDQAAIQTLKERVIQLEMEHGEEKGDTSVDELVEKLKLIKNQLDSANLLSEKPIDITAVLMETFGDSNIVENCHEQCKLDYDELRQEFDNYKKKLNSLQKEISPSASLRMEVNNEVESLRSQVQVLKERVRSLHQHIEQLQAEHKKEIELKNQSLVMERRKEREKHSLVETEWRERVMELEGQLGKQRERAITMLKEKDAEIAALKDSFILPNFNSNTLDGGEEGGGMLLHYREEVARRDVELTRLRKDKLAQETELREAQRLIAQLKQKHSDLTSALHQQLDRFERCQSREGANLEYLKNVVLSFLLSNDASCKSHMLNAIAAVLKFTQDERNKIAQHSWWYARTV